MRIDTEITPYERCLLLALVETADWDAVTAWMEKVGFVCYSTIPENVERATMEMRDKLLRIWEDE